MRPHDTIHGQVLYTSRQPQRLGAERGREQFTITRHGDGTRVLRAHCEIDDEPNVMRDVVVSLDSNWKTRQAFSRLSVADEDRGSCWYRFTDTEAQAEGFHPASGRYSETVKYDQTPDLFGMHPIQGDAWYLNSVDISQGPCVKLFDRYLMTTLDHRGATEPKLAWRAAGMRVEFIGHETITVAAGTFDALHFCYGERGSDKEGRNAPGQHPAYEIWTTADGEFIFLKGFITGYMQTHYELTELKRIPAQRQDQS